PPARGGLVQERRRRRGRGGGRRAPGHAGRGGVGDGLPVGGGLAGRRPAALARRRRPPAGGGRCIRGGGRPVVVAAAQAGLVPVVGVGGVRRAPGGLRRDLRQLGPPHVPAPPCVLAGPGHQRAAVTSRWWSP